MESLEEIQQSISEEFEIFDTWIVSDRSSAVWIVYLITGVLWLTIGLLFWRKRPKKAARPRKRKSQ